MKNILKYILITGICSFSYIAEAVSLHAHQGEFFLAPPNSAEAVRLAFEKGSRYVEFDVFITDSNELYCVHGDPEVKHQWNIDKPATALTRQDIENSRFRKNWYGNDFSHMRLSTLDEVLAVVPTNGFIVADIRLPNKKECFFKKFDEAIVKAGLRRSNVIIPVQFIKKFREVSKEYNKATFTLYLNKPSPEKNLSAEEIIARVKKHKEGKFVKMISIGQAGQGEEYLKRINDKDFFRKIKAAGYKAAAWTTDDSKFAKKLIDEYGVDIIYTNRAEAMRKDLNIPRER